MKTAIIHHPIYEKHDTGFGHPETSDRYRVIIESLRRSPFWQDFVEVAAEKAKQGVIQAVHTTEHFKYVERAVAEGRGFLDADTVVSVHSFDAALYAAGGVCSAIDAVMQSKANNAFVVARPPGHHATAQSSMGFCLFNNVAVGARYAQNFYEEIERVAIVDWDVHHGNGTQAIFYDDPTVFFFSIHQYPWYPGTGSRGETGYGRGKGFTLNIPVKAGTPAKEHRRMFEGAISEIANKFKPDLIIISAGFDAHLSDPLGQLRLEDEDFVEMTKVVKQWAKQACNDRIISVLEGGYNLRTLGETVKSHVVELSRD
ncbi:MAG: histone deacetylase [Pyrinomonadaceae bacterium]|nr:histone deacetylase [Pyrinomonadaceae bacterium]MCX7639791.1 histone deacetylase [Pyrinomonadaceae bacterium]MDW8304374.1 histone deacetylase [Acidobacteriota bacterium]